MPSGKTTIFRKFRKNRKNGHFFPSSTLKMVGLLQLKLPTSTLVGFLINGLIMNLLQHIFFRKRRITFFNSKNQEVGFFVCFPDFCFSYRKAYDLCSPENLSGDHRKHRGKCENSGFSPALQLYVSSHPHARSQESKIFGRVFLPLNASGRIFRL